MKTRLGWALLGLFVCFLAVVTVWAGPSLPVIKPPVQSPALLTGPPADPTAAQGQWFLRPGGLESPRSHEFYDDEAEIGGGYQGRAAIDGYVSSITYQDGIPGNPIVAFTIEATIRNDHAAWAEPYYYYGENSHGESLSISGFESYIGTMYSTMLVAEFAVVDGETLPPQFTPPYRQTIPLIHAVNEDQRAWYCWNPDDQNPEHDPQGGYFVPAWEFGFIDGFASPTRQLDFAVPGGLPDTDPRYSVLVHSHATQSDILLNRTQSLKISTWIDDVAVDVMFGESPPLRRSNASVFHDIAPAEPDLDFGDAPPPYPTLWVNNGARHVVVPGVHMGLLIDAENGGQPTPLADGDDLNNLADEDGVVFPGPLVAGRYASVQISVSVPGYLHGWIDFDADGSWAEVHDQILQTAYVSSPGLHTVNFLVPASAAIGPTFARFRFCTQQITLSDVGLAPDGEVEDYLVEILEDEEPGDQYDFGDAPDPTYPTLLANNGARHQIVPGLYLGAGVDPEPDGQPTPNADGDDKNVLYPGIPYPPGDEDGVTFPAALFRFVQNPVHVVAAIPVGYAPVFNLWIDLNGNGSWADPGEHVLVDQPVVNGLNTYSFNPGPLGAAGSTFARARLSTATGLGFDGPAPDGEVEDYEIPIAPEKWLQRPDLSEYGVDVDMTEVQLADDFYCTASGPITDIHIWTSFLNDELPTEGLDSLSFILNLYSDVPVGPENPDYSHPGDLLWSRSYTPGTYNVALISSGTEEWWHDPLTGTWLFPGDTQVFQYDFDIPPDEAFRQTEGTIYWLGVSYALPPGPDTVGVGWKSSLEQWNDSATWYNPAGMTWQELRYGGEHPDAGDSMDLAFAITGLEEAEEPELDFGDAPDSPAAPQYPTLLSNNGARHIIVPGVFMGTLIDAEPDGQPTVGADGDDLNNLADEDGVVFLTPLVAGQTATVQISISVTGYIYGWLDFNANSTWADPGEQIINSGLVMGPGTYSFPFTVPATAAIGNTYARFRFTTFSMPLGYAGLAFDGEVEDYLVDIREEEEEPEMDFGDAMDSVMVAGYPTLLVNNGARHLIVPGVFLGAGVDGEPDGQPTPSANGDDMNLFFPGIPFPPGDEDGVVIPAPLIAGDTVQVLVTASVPGFLNAWIDWNANMNWIDPGEQVFVNQPLVAGVNSLTLNVPLPPAIVAGGPHSRWRFTTYPVATPSFTGLETDGEVEDHEVRLEVLDFGDAPDPYPTLLAQDGARHRIPTTPVYWLGPLAPDAEPDGQPTPNADGDDLNNLPDEDGVAVILPLIRGSFGQFDILASASGVLQAWIDFDADGDWSTPGDQIATDMPLSTGLNSLAVPVPSTAALGPTYARFRFGSELGILPTGLAIDGEVEDHLLIIYQSGPSGDIVITNITHSAADEMTIQWTGESDVVYETQYILDLMSEDDPPWTPWGALVERAPYEQADPAATETMKHYRVIAPFAPPPP